MRWLRALLGRLPRLKAALRWLLSALGRLLPGGRLRRQADVLAEEGRRQLLLGHHGQARAACLQARRLWPQHRLARKLLGWIATEQGNWPAAARQWRALLASRLNPAEEAEALNALALALIYLGAFKEAGALLDRLEAMPSGGLMAQEQRLLLAQKSLDDKAHAAARRAYRERFPDAAAQSTAWLRFAGGEDPPEAPRYTEADLAAAPDAAAARLILAYLELRLPHARYLQLARQAVEALSDPMLAKGKGGASRQTQAAAQMQMEYLFHLLNYLAGPEELAEAQRRARALVQRLPESARARRLQAEAAVAANDRAGVQELVRASGGGDLELWLAAAGGDHDRARAVWERSRRRACLSAADNRGLHLRLASKEPQPDFLKKADRILLFTAFRNERAFAPWFLDWYRRQGVERFFIVDNLSTDGTADYLAKQKDVTLFESRDSYAWAHSGMKWVNELMRRYGDGHWCVYVDADEQLLAPPASPSASHSPPPRKSGGRAAPLPGCHGRARRGSAARLHAGHLPGRPRGAQGLPPRRLAPLRLPPH